MKLSVTADTVAYKADFFLSLSKSKFAGWLAVATIFLNLVSLLTRVLDSLVQNPATHFAALIFSVDKERNIPALYSVVLLLSCSVLLAGIASLKSVARDVYTVHWAVLSSIFLFFSWDEAVQIHERLIRHETYLELLNGVGINNEGIFTFAWVAFAIACLMLFSLFYLKFLLSLPSTHQMLFLIAFFLFVGGAVGMEMIAGTLIGDISNFDEASDSLLYIAVSSIEELLEMLGIVTFIHALMSYLGSYLKVVEVKVRG